MVKTTTMIKTKFSETFAKSGKLFLSVIPDLFVGYQGFFGQFSPHEPGISLNIGYFRLRGCNIPMYAQLFDDRQTVWGVFSSYTP